MGISLDGWVWLPASRRCCSNLGLSPAWAAVAWSIARCNKLWPLIRSHSRCYHCMTSMKYNQMEPTLISPALPRYFQQYVCSKQTLCSRVQMRMKKLLSVLKGFSMRLHVLGQLKKLGRVERCCSNYLLEPLDTFRKGIHQIYVHYEEVWISEATCNFGILTMLLTGGLSIAPEGLQVTLHESSAAASLVIRLCYLLLLPLTAWGVWNDCARYVR